MATLQAQQLIYKWTDAQGQIQYSELAPPTGTKYEMVQKPGTGPNAAASVDLNKEQADLAKQAAEQAQKEKEQVEKSQKEADDTRTKNCEVSKKNVAALQSDSPVIKTDSQGNKVTLDTEQRTAELKKAQKDQEYYCNP
jgi:type IV secretory pathway VirJ component